MINFSVIIPVYNAEKTIRRCVDSLRSQEHNEIEVILVNDGSKDGSGEICKCFAEQDSRVRYLDKPNGGVSSARNAGLDIAQGKYILFVDSDDYVPTDLFDHILCIQNEADWDWIVLSYYVDDGTKKVKITREPVCAKNRTEALPNIIQGICSKALNSPWAKVFRKEIIEQNGIRFPVGASVAEDRAFNIRYSMYVHTFRVSDKAGYYVNVENEQSLSRKQHKDLNEQFKIVDEYIQQSIREAEIPENEKNQYVKANNFGVLRSIYKEAKDLRKEQINWVQRQKALWKLCGKINQKRMKYPKTKYCRMITLPVKLRQTWIIDLIAKVLNSET